MALTFKHKADYDLIQEDDIFKVIGLENFEQGSELSIVVTHADNRTDTIRCNHTYNNSQVAWFKAGSALNVLKSDH